MRIGIIVPFGRGFATITSQSPFINWEARRRKLQTRLMLSSPQAWMNAKLEELRQKYEELLKRIKEEYAAKIRELQAKAQRGELIENYYQTVLQLQRQYFLAYEQLKDAYYKELQQILQGVQTHEAEVSKQLKKKVPETFIKVYYDAPKQMLKTIDKIAEDLAKGKVKPAHEYFKPVEAETNVPHIKAVVEPTTGRVLGYHDEKRKMSITREAAEKDWGFRESATSTERVTKVIKDEKTGKVVGYHVEGGKYGGGASIMITNNTNKVIPSPFESLKPTYNSTTSSTSQQSTSSQQKTSNEKKDEGFLGWISNTIRSLLPKW